jgi:UDP-N-acetylglucosamine--N-acetylmuramyl-(pentapeptide) pyrophosphoryl-undecaprenol N-acetylglucosamine transferase
LAILHLKILIAGGGTGGHLTPALALAQAIREVRPDIEPVLVGARRGIEVDILPRYPFRYHLLPLEPLYRRAWWRNLRWPFLLWPLWREIGRVLATERPAVVVGTGGYAAGPVVWRAQREGLPTALLEQNALPGVATRWLARRARQVHLGFPETRARLSPGPRTEIYSFGNPIRPPPPIPSGGGGDRAAALASFGLEANRPTVLVFGGSQGARALNRAVAEALERELLTGVNLLWGTGTPHAARHAHWESPGRVAVRGFFDPMTSAYHAADLVVSRAGAMTVSELCAWGKPSVLVPLPTATGDHQRTNARALVDAGAAVLLDERDLTAASLARAVTDLVAAPARLSELARSARSRGNPTAVRDVVSRILTLIL